MRIPSAFCGNVGLKPSFGRVPAYPLSPFGTVSHLGPHTMSVRDAALMLSVLAQPDARDWTSLPPDGRDYRVGLDDGRLDPERWHSYLKLRDELAAAAESLEAQLRRKSESRVLTKALDKRLDEKYGRH